MKILMKGKILKAIVAVLTIMALTLSDFLIVGKSIVYALDSLEDQETNVNEQLEFDVYFKTSESNEGNGNSGSSESNENNENKVHTTQITTTEESNLYINVNVKDAGILNDGKITIQNPNFKIKDAYVSDSQNEYIKSVDCENNVIELNPIQYGNNVEITVPISFEKQDNIEVSYFGRETSVKLEGTYTESENNVENVSKEIAVKAMWINSADTTIETTIEKYLELEEGKTLLEQALNVSVNDNILPKENEKIEITVPEITEKVPTQITVLKNGNKLQDENVTYNSEEKTVEIYTQNTANNEGRIEWNDGNDEYKIIYVYETELANETIKLNATVTTKIYEIDEEIEKNNEQDINLEEKGEIANLNIESTNYIYKGYMYANKTNETTYSQTYKVEISNVDEIEGLEITSNGDKFITESEEEKSTNESTYFKEIKLSKSNIQTVLGEEGTISLQDKDGNEIVAINKDTEADEDGNITLKKTDENGNQVDLQLNEIKIVTSKPAQEGVIEITANKAIKGNTSYDKETLKTFTKLESSIKVKTTKGEDTQTASTELKDTTTKATLNISNSNLSTINTNEGITLTVTLKENSNEYDLFKNPTIKIDLPKEIETIDKSNITAKKLYADGFTITKNDIIENEDGSQSIILEFEGEQEEFGIDEAEGMTIVITTDITVDKLTPTGKSNIKMTYTNENGNEAQYEENCEINFNSKDGVLAYSGITEFNESGETVETLSSEIPTGTLDMNKEERTATVKNAVINNYSNEINNVSIIGKIPCETDDEIGETYLEGTFETQLQEPITVTMEGAKVYYSEDAYASVDSDSWTESYENAKAYKIELPNNSMQSGSKIEFSYKINIPVGLTYNECMYTYYEVNYTYKGSDSQTSYSAIMLATEVNEELIEAQSEDIMVASESYTTEDISEDDSRVQVIEIADGVKAYIMAYSGTDYLDFSETPTLQEGQNIKYTVKIENNSGTDITNLKLIAEHTNALYYDTKVIQMLGNDYDEEGNKIPIDTNWYVLYDDDEEKTSIELASDGIKAGESSTFEYEVQITKTDDTKMEGNLKVECNELEDTVTKKLNDINIEDGKLALSLLKYNYIEYEYTVGYPVSQQLIVKNLSDSTLSNQKITIPLNGQVTVNGVGYGSGEDCAYEISNDNLILTIAEINAGEEINIYIEDYVNAFDGGHLELTLQANAEVEGVTYYSNEFIEGVDYNLSKLDIGITEETTNDIYDVDDEIEFKVTIKNNANFTDYVTAKVYCPDEIELLTVEKDGEESTSWIIGEELETQETKEITYKFKVVEIYEKSEVDIDFSFITGSYSGEKAVTVKIGKVIEETDGIIDEIDDTSSSEDDGTNSDSGTDDNNNTDDTDDTNDTNDDNNNTNNTGNTDNDNNNTDNTDDNTNDNNTGKDNDNEDNDNNTDNDNNKYSINGKAWLDSDKNGTMDNGEETIQGIKVYLLDSSTGKIVTINNSKATTITDESGKYEFTQVPNGNYIVVFDYDSEKYRVTTYKNEDSEEDENSDAISKQMTIDSVTKTFGITDTIEIKSDQDNINIGLIENETFDLKLDKYITKVIVQNSAGTTQNEYSNTKLAKVEINSKNLANSTVIIEYTLNITNEGEISGYVGDLIDYIPNDLTFSSEINKNWYKATDGFLHNITLADTIIEPGKTTSVTLTLTKTMTNNNVGTVINTAEIGKATNDLSISDTDSTPANNVDTEDDYGKAEVIISVGTGAGTIISLLVILIILIGMGLWTFNVRRKEGKE